MPSSRDEILASVRKHLVESTPLPELTGPWIEYPDPIAQFASVLEMIGGRCVRVPNVEAINAELDATPAYSAAKQTVSRILGGGVYRVNGRFSGESRFVTRTGTALFNRVGNAPRVDGETDSFVARRAGRCPRG